VITRTVTVGQSCQIRKNRNPAKGFHWCLIKLVAKRGTAAILLIDGNRVALKKGERVDFVWNCPNGVAYPVSVANPGRTHGKNHMSLSIEAPPAIGIQWDGFIGTIRSGQ